MVLIPLFEGSFIQSMVSARLSSFPFSTSPFSFWNLFMKSLSSDLAKRDSPLQPINTLLILTLLPIFIFIAPTWLSDFCTEAEFPPPYTSPSIVIISELELPLMLIFTLFVIGRHEFMFTIFAASLAAIYEGIVSRIGTV